MNCCTAQQILRRQGMRAALALRKFHREGGFNKIMFLYERTRYLYENKEGHVQNEAKTKLKTRCFLTKIARKNPRFGAFLQKKPKTLAEGNRSCPSADGHPETVKYPGARASCPQRTWQCGAKCGQDSRAPKEMKNRGNEARKWLKTKDITFFRGAIRAHFARKFAQI